MTLHRRDFKDAIDWTNDVLREHNTGLASSVFRITNFEDELLQGLRLVESIEKLLETQGEVYLPAVQLLLQSLLDKAKEDARK